MRRHLQFISFQYGWFMNTSLFRLVLLLGVSLLVLAGCGSSQGASSSPTGTPSTASGDIADTATYLTYHGTGYSLKYVEGWGIQQGPGRDVTMSDKDSSERVAIQNSTRAGSLASADLARLRRTAPQFRLLARHAVRLPSGDVGYVQYRTLSAQDPVTGKRVPVIVDRYYIPGSGKVAVLSLSTPVAVDNLDAFRLIARSFRWR